MSITPTADNSPYLFLLSFGVLAALPVLAIIGAILGKIFRNDSLPILFVIGTCAAVFIGGSLYLDRAGTVTPAQVLGKSEEIRIQSQDFATHRYNVTLNYSASGTAEKDTVPLSEAEFDAVHTGQSIRLRAVRLFNMFTLKRLDAQSTLTLIPWNIVLPVLGLIVIIWLMVKVRRLQFVIVVIGLIACAVFAITRLQVSPAMTRTATATVRRVERIAPSSGGGSEHTVLDNAIWVDTGIVILGLDDYDFAELEFTPQGRSEPVVAVDVVNTNGQHKVEAGGTVPVNYAPDAPRSAQTPFSERRAWLQNGAVLAVVGGALLLIALGLDRLTEGRKTRSASSH